MNRTLFTPLARLTALLLVFGLVGCNAFTGTDENEANEVRVTVIAIGSDYLDADDGLRYEVTANTQYEGFSSFADVAVDAVVDIEFEEIANSNNRRALEIEAPGAKDND